MGSTDTFTLRSRSLYRGTHHPRQRRTDNLPSERFKRRARLQGRRLAHCFRWHLHLSRSFDLQRLYCFRHATIGGLALTQKGERLARLPGNDHVSLCPNPTHCETLLSNAAGPAVTRHLKSMAISSNALRVVDRYILRLYPRRIDVVWSTDAC